MTSAPVILFIRYYISWIITPVRKEVCQLVTNDELIDRFFGRNTFYFHKEKVYYVYLYPNVS